MIRLHGVFIGILVSLTVAGCLGPRSDPSQFFVLTPLADTTGSQSGTPTSDLTLGIGPVTFPAYLNRAQMATRAGSNRLEFDQYACWAGPLKADFIESLEENLSMLLATEQTVTYPWYSSTFVDLAVEVDVLRFEADTSGVAELQSRWRIKDGKSGERLEAGEWSSTKPAGSTEPEATVAALSGLLADFSAQIAATVRRLHTAR